MQRLLMAASSILWLTTVAHSQPFAPHRPAHPAAFILAADDDSGSPGDASATDNADEGSSATSDVGVTDNGGGDQSPDAADAGDGTANPVTENSDATDSSDAAGNPAADSGVGGPPQPAPPLAFPGIQPTEPHFINKGVNIVPSS